MSRREEEATQIRLINNDLPTLKAHVQAMKDALGDRFMITGQPREGTRGDCLAFGLILPPRDPEPKP